VVKSQTDIDQRIWQVVALIPPGTVATYGDVARQAGLPGAARRVGRALRGLPPDTRIPWHRVINAQGRLSLPQGSSALSTQRARLEAEGVSLPGGTKVNLATYRWQPGRAVTADHASGQAAARD
jgi:methylated-DNA-protein-cysteine methyltransferase-like protein